MTFLHKTYLWTLKNKRTKFGDDSLLLHGEIAALITLLSGVHRRVYENVVIVLGYYSVRTFLMTVEKQWKCSLQVNRLF